MGSITIFRRILLLNKKRKVHLRHDVAHKTYYIRESHLHIYFLSSDETLLSRLFLRWLGIVLLHLLIVHANVYFLYAMFDFLLKGLLSQLLMHLVSEEWPLLATQFQ